MSFEFETLDEIPAGGRPDHTQLQETIAAFKRTVEADPTKAGKWVALKVSDNKESIAATTSTLKEKHGEATVGGLTFAHRPYHADSSKRAIYMTYEPHKIVPGAAEAHAAARKARLKAQNESAKVRKAEKKAAEEKAKAASAIDPEVKAEAEAARAEKAGNGGQGNVKQTTKA